MQKGIALILGFACRCQHVHECSTEDPGTGAEHDWDNGATAAS